MFIPFLLVYELFAESYVLWVVSAVPAVRLVLSVVSSVLLAPLKKFYTYFSFTSMFSAVCIASGFENYFFTFIPVISYAEFGFWWSYWAFLTEALVARFSNRLFLFEDIGRLLMFILWASDLIQAGWWLLLLEVNPMAVFWFWNSWALEYRSLGSCP